MKLNKQFLAVLLLVSLLLALAGPALAAWQGEGLSYISLSGYYRNLVFDDGLISAQNAEELWGIIDEEGRVVLPFRYTSLYSITHGLFAAETEDGSEVIINSSGEVKLNGGWVRWWDNGFCVYDNDTYTEHFYTWDLQECGAGTVCFGKPALDAYNLNPYSQIAEGCYTVSESRNGRSYQGVINEAGQTIVPAEYDYVTAVTDGTKTVFLGTLRSSSTYTLYNEQGRQIRALTGYSSVYGYYDSDTGPASALRLTIWQSDGTELSGLLDLDGNDLVPMGDYDCYGVGFGSVNPSGCISAPLNSGGSRLYKNGKLVQSWDDMTVTTLSGTDAVVFSSEDGAGLMEMDGTVLIAPEFGRLWTDKAGNLQAARASDSIFMGYEANGVFTIAGEVIVPADYARVDLELDRYIAEKEDGTTDVYRTDGSLVLSGKMGVYSYTGFLIGEDENGGECIWNSEGELLYGPWYGRIRQNYTPLDWIEYETKWNGARFLPFLLQVQEGDGWRTVKTLELDLQTGTLAYEFPYEAYAVNQSGYYAYILDDGSWAIGRVDLPAAPAFPDLNGDGALTADDAGALFAYVSGKPLPAAAPDLDADGKINNRDAILLFRMMTNMVYIEILE